MSDDDKDELAVSILSILAAVTLSIGVAKLFGDGFGWLFFGTIATIEWIIARRDYIAMKKTEATKE